MVYNIDGFINIFYWLLHGMERALERSVDAKTKFAWLIMILNNKDRLCLFRARLHEFKTLKVCIHLFSSKA